MWAEFVNRAECSLGERRCGRPGRELDDESGAVRVAVVFPARDAPRISGELLERKTDRPRESPLDRRVAARLVDQILVLVEQDRDRRSNSVQERGGCPRFGL